MWRTIKGSSWLLGMLLAGPLVLGGCGEAGEDGEQSPAAVQQLKQALPQTQEMIINLPESSALVGEQAEMYEFTRSITWHVNGFVWVITQLIENVVEHPPTTVVGEEEAIWGPYQEPLAPAAWQVHVERVAPGTYQYTVQGWPRGESVEAARVVLEGEHTEGSSEGHGAGSWTYHLTEGHALDPVAHEGLGDIEVTYDIGAARSLEVRFIDVQGPSDPMINSTLYRYTEAADRSGTFDFISNLDLDEGEQPQRNRRELLQVRSRWLPTGEGRTDAVATHGDLPQGMQADVVECWDDAFVSSYVSYEVGADRAEEGDQAACPYAERQLPDFEDFDPAQFADADLVAAVPVPADFEVEVAPVEDPVDEPAIFYSLTRSVVDGVNAQVRGVLEGVEELLRHPPSSCSEDTCVWGPWTDWDNGLSSRMTIERLQQGLFSFRQEIKLLSEAAGAWTVLQEGELTESSDDGDGRGWFVFDLDVLAAISAEEGLTGRFRAELERQGEVVTLRVRYEGITWDVALGPQDVRYQLVARPDGSGDLDALYFADTDEGNPERAALEQVEVHSAWIAGGAGVASIRVTGGDVQDGMEGLLVQCWDEHAASAHEHFLAQAAGAGGTPDVDGQACVFDSWSEPGLPAMGDE